MRGCLICGDTGYDAFGEPCKACSSNAESNVLPTLPTIPIQYQGVRFNKTFLPNDMQSEYGTYMEELIERVVKGTDFYKNILICSRPNSGKTVFAYTVLGMLYNKGIVIPEVRDIIEVRDIMINYYADTDETELWSKAKLAIIKIPVDISVHMFDTMSTVVERRVRNNGSTIFLYGGTRKDILAQDRFGRLKSLEGDGSYNSIEIKTW